MRRLYVENLNDSCCKYVFCYTGAINTTTAQTRTQPQSTLTTAAAATDSLKAVDPGLQAAVAGCIVLTVALILVLASNVILCRQQKKSAASVIYQTYDGSTSAIMRERSEQEEPDLNLLRVTTEVTPSQAPRVPARPPSTSSTSSCDSGDLNYYIQPIAEVPSFHAPKAPPSPGPVSEGVINGNNKSGRDSDSESGNDYENTGSHIDHLLKSANIYTPGESQNPISVHDPNNLQRAPSIGSCSTSSGEDYQNTAFNRENPQNPDGASQSNSEKFKLAPLPTRENHGGFNHYNRSYLPASNCDQDDSSSTSSGEDYENVPVMRKAPLEDPEDQSSSDSDYDDVPYDATS
ncbi:uncharacterized protein LOC116222410 [Clupea harengus]|uniref:Uncharacterized protein LOC116222410 n=1 Tax=Clupea harengus TaxID=7950 RepID=A0A6P8FZ91_CLUHA|nr:uncharacterized protein LOC116222410 [Clupea harengus]